MYKQLYKQNKVWIAFVGICVFLLLAFSTSNVHAATINVGCDVAELKAAIHTANDAPGPDTIELAANCTYTLDSVDSTSSQGPNGLPGIGGSLVIHGNDAVIERSSADGTPDFRLMQIFGGPPSVELYDLTLRNGKSSLWGGGLLNFGNLKMVRVTFEHNTSLDVGGALANFEFTANIRASRFIDNHAERDGGAIASFGAGKGIRGTLIVRATTFDGNHAAYGGAVWVGQGGLVKIDRSTFSNNHAEGGEYGGGGGGGIVMSGYGRISNSTFAQNVAEDHGGGVFKQLGTLELVNVTFAKNAARRGGALYNIEGTTTLINTILGNSSGAKNCKINGGTVIDGGHNLNTDTSCGIGPATKILFDKAGLQNNGGPTKTIGLRRRSPAVDAGDDAVCAAAPVKARDQRGVVRPQGTHCDIGAFELEP